MTALKPRTAFMKKVEKQHTSGKLSEMVVKRALILQEELKEESK